MFRMVFLFTVLATVSVCQEFPGSDLGRLLNDTTGLNLNSPNETLGGLDAFITALDLGRDTIRLIIRVVNSVDIANLVQENQVSANPIHLTELPCWIAYSCIVCVCVCVFFCLCNCY